MTTERKRIKICETGPLRRCEDEPMRVLRESARAPGPGLPAAVSWATRQLLESTAYTARREVLTQLRDKAERAKESVYDLAVMVDLADSVKAFVDDALNQSPGGVPHEPVEAAAPIMLNPGDEPPARGGDSKRKVDCEACGHPNTVPATRTREAAAPPRKDFTIMTPHYRESAADIFKRAYREGDTFVEAGRPIPKGASAAEAFAMTGDAFDNFNRTQPAAPPPVRETEDTAAQFIESFERATGRRTFMLPSDLLPEPRASWRGLIESVAEFLGDGAPFRSRGRRTTYAKTHNLSTGETSFVEAYARDAGFGLDEPRGNYTATELFRGVDTDPDLAILPDSFTAWD